MDRVGAVKIKEGIYWTGALNPDLRIFDIVMETAHGTTYNSYVVKGEKIAVFETVKDRFFSEYLARLKEVINPAEIEYIVVDHTEPDHAGSVFALLDQAPNAKVVGSKSALRFLKAITNREFPAIEAKEGMTIDLGGKTLQFIMAPFLHWPDSMYTYIPEDRVLITCDSFGSHYSSPMIFDDLVGDFNSELRYYYDVIMSPFAGYVLEAINKIRSLPVDVFCPGHGPVLRSRGWEIVDLYEQWSKELLARQNQGPVLIAYISAYGYTRAMAAEIARGIASVNGCEVEVVEITEISLSELKNKIEKARAFLIGSPTINRDAVKPAWDMLSVVCPIKNKNKPVAAFGSFGWSGEATRMLEERMSALGLKVVQPALRVNFKPSEKELRDCFDFGVAFAQSLGKDETGR